MSHLTSFALVTAVAPSFAQTRPDSISHPQSLLLFALVLLLRPKAKDPLGTTLHPYMHRPRSVRDLMSCRGNPVGERSQCFFPCSPLLFLGQTILWHIPQGSSEVLEGWNLSDPQQWPTQLCTKFYCFIPIPWDSLSKQITCPNAIIIAALLLRGNAG